MPRQLFFFSLSLVENLLRWQIVKIQLKRSKVMAFFNAVLTAVGYVALLLILLFGFAWIYARFVARQGQLVTKYFKTAQGTRLTVTVVSGDLGSNLIFREIFLEDSYFQHGISLANDKSTDSPLVIDCGANIGLFAAMCATKVDQLEVHCFEPIPLLAEAARRNAKWALAQRGGGAKPKVDGKGRSITIHEIGLASKPTTAEFMFNPVFTAGCTMHVDDISKGRIGTKAEKETFSSKMATAIRLIRALILDAAWMGVVPGWFGNFTAFCLGIPLLREAFIVVVLIPLAIGSHVIGMALPVKMHPVHGVKLEPLSNLLDGAVPDLVKSGRRIDYLKVDVEGAELDVLLGIRDDHWELVDQCVIEVHNVDGRLEQVQRLLQSKGLTQQKIGGQWLAIQELLDFETIFAKRPSPSGSQ
jgi:hypothetical protein